MADDRICFLVHLEDPPGSRVAVCTGDPLVSDAGIPASTPRVLCTGCSFLSPLLREARGDVARLSARLEEARVFLANGNLTTGEKIVALSEIVADSSCRSHNGSGEG